MSLRTQEDYIAALKGHDWTYEMSDDHQVWQRGLYVQRNLEAYRREHDKDWAIWNQHAPTLFQVRVGKVKP